MQRLGFIHDMLDVKVLILFVMARVNYPVTSNEIYELFAEMDISHRTVDIAKHELGIRSVKRGDRWYWSGRK